MLNRRNTDMIIHDAILSAHLPIGGKRYPKQGACLEAAFQETGCRFLGAWHKKPSIITTVPIHPSV